MISDVYKQWYSDEARDLTIEALVKWIFGIIQVRVPGLGIPVISHFIKWVIKTGIGHGMENGILIVNDLWIDKEVDGDLKDFLNAYKAARDLPEDASQEEIDAINEAQIRAARKFLSVGRDRV